MKIISNFHDYYDSAQAFGQDQSVVYMRKTEVIKEADEKNDQVAAIFREFEKHIDTIERMRKSVRTKKGILFMLWPKVFLFCGKTYPCVMIEKSVPNSIKTEKTFMYDEESIKSYFENYDIDLADPIKWFGYNIFKYRGSHTMKKIVRDFFTKVKVNEDVLIQSKASCLMMRIDGHRRPEITVNPLLADYEFYKVFDAWSAYQELDMFIGGVLSWPHNLMIEISDADRVKQHGFDEKYGFRTRPKSV